MKILVVGGGSGGHVLPLVPVLKEIRERYSDAELRVWSDAKFHARTVEVIGELGDTSIKVETISSGKIRRYHSVPLWQQLLRLRTIVFPNIVDSCKMAIGIAQSYGRLRAWRPDVVFCKGGFVSVPVGIAARLLHIPIVLHDSDAHPGLANRLLSRWAESIATGAPAEHYPYPASKMRYVGIPIKDAFRVYSAQEMTVHKESLGFDASRPLVTITGGGLGAKTINDAVALSLDDILKISSVLLISGDYQYKELKEQLTRYDDSTRFQLHAFLGKEMLPALAASDLTIARAGATTLLELAALAKPTILIPNPHLAGGHQTKNAKAYEDAGAVAMIEESALETDPALLYRTVSHLISHDDERLRLGVNMHEFAHPNATRDVVNMIIAAIKEPGLV